MADEDTQEKLRRLTEARDEAEQQVVAMTPDDPEVGPPPGFNPEELARAQQLVRTLQDQIDRLAGDPPTGDIDV